MEASAASTPAATAATPMAGRGVGRGSRAGDSDGGDALAERVADLRRCVDALAERGSAPPDVQLKLSALEASHAALAARVEGLAREPRESPGPAVTGKGSGVAGGRGSGADLSSDERGDVSSDERGDVSSLQARLSAVEAGVTAAEKERESVAIRVESIAQRVVALEGSSTRGASTVGVTGGSQSSLSGNGGKDAAGEGAVALRRLGQVEELVKRVEAAAGAHCFRPLLRS